jgi:L-fuculokinase
VSGQAPAKEAIAILDVGKTHTKLAIVDAMTGATLRGHERPSVPIPTPLGPQLDVQGIEEWLFDRFAATPEASRLRAIVPIAHGAAAVLLDRAGVVLAAPDYDNPVFEEVGQAYRVLRDDFSVTFSPFLGRGLNLGRQLYWLQTRSPDLFERCDQILTYPQYLAWRLSRVAACEWTSLGCHTDLWRPLAQKPSLLAVAQGWADRLAPVRAAGDTLASIDPEWARKATLDPKCRVLCGMHDSSASYLALGAPFAPGGVPHTVVSSGTWTICMTSGRIPVQRLAEDRDMLANVDIAGQPVATARFAGGREYRAIVGAEGETVLADEAELPSVLQSKAMVIPSFSSDGGPFAGRIGQLIRAERLTATGRVALASLYLALMTDLLLGWLGAHGDIVVDGPLADNAVYTQALACLRLDQCVKRSDRRQAMVYAGLHLAGFAVDRSMVTVSASRVAMVDALHDYRLYWRRLLPNGAIRRCVS